MSVSATQFRIDLKNLLIGVKRGESYDIVKHNHIIGRLVPGDTVATPDMTISATNVRVKFKDVITQLNAGGTYHILKHKRVLAALVPADYAASTVDIETVEDEAYNATNDAMDALSEAMNPVTPETEIPASEQTFTPSGYRLDTLTPIVEDDTNWDIDPNPHIAAVERAIDEQPDDIEVSEPVSVVEQAIDENDDYNRLDTFTMKQLHSYAKTNDIEMPPMLRKEEVKAVIRESLDKRGGHDYLDEEHDDQYDAFFADLQERSDIRSTRRNRTV